MRGTGFEQRQDVLASLRASSLVRLRRPHSPLTKLFAENARDRIRTGGNLTSFGFQGSNRSTIAVACELARDSNARDRIRTGGPLRDSVLSAAPASGVLRSNTVLAPRSSARRRVACVRRSLGVWRTLTVLAVVLVSPSTPPRTIKVARGTAFCDTSTRGPLSRRSPPVQIRSRGTASRGSLDSQHGRRTLTICLPVPGSRRLVLPVELHATTEIRKRRLPRGETGLFGLDSVESFPASERYRPRLRKVLDVVHAVLRGGPRVV